MKRFLKQEGCYVVHIILFPWSEEWGAQLLMAFYVDKTELLQIGLQKF